VKKKWEILENIKIPRKNSPPQAKTNVFAVLQGKTFKKMVKENCTY